MIAAHVTTKAPPCPVVPRSAIYGAKKTTVRDWLNVSSQNQYAPVTRNQVRDTVIAVCGVPLMGFQSSSRTRKFTRARHIYFFLCRVHTRQSMPKIGLLAGVHDHTSVKYGASKVAVHMKDFEQDVAAVESALGLSPLSRQMHLLGDYEMFYRKQTNFRGMK